MRTKVNLYTPGYLENDKFIMEIKQSKYWLHILGVGDPDTRTFEILASGSLRIAQKSNLKWTFEKIVRLENEPGLYEKCLQHQNEIIKTYMNLNILKKYIINFVKEW